MGSKSFILFLLLAIFSIFSCSNTEPGILGVYPQFIYDLESKEMYLSVFASFTSDISRIEKMELKHDDYKLLWKCNDLEFVHSQDNKYEYVGCSSFSTVEKIFPSGSYQVVFFDSTGKKVSYNFMLKDIMLPENAEKVPRKERYVAIYDVNEEIIFLGRENTSIDQINELKNKYPDGIYRRRIIKSKESNVMYFMTRDSL